MIAARVRGVLIVLFAAGALTAPAAAVDRSLGAGIATPAPAGQPWAARQKRRLSRDIDALLEAAPTLRGAHVGLLAVDARSGDVVYARNPDAAFVPASTLKLLTGSVALATLGPDFRFRTEAYAGATTERGRPVTSLVVRAGGDPLLTASDVVALAHSAATTGTRNAPYAVGLDRGAFDVAPYPPGWAWDDFDYGYAAKLSPLPIDENAIALTVTPGRAAGDPLEVRPSGPGPSPGGLCADPIVAPGIAAGRTGLLNSTASIDVEVVADSSGPCLAVVGSLPAGGPAQTLDAALPDPTASFYRLVLRTLLVPDGTSPPLAIERMSMDRLYETAQVPAGARLVWAHAGEPLADLLADIWWPSDNFAAEMLLRAIGRQSAGMPGTTEAGAGAERVWLAGIGIPPSTVTLVDGSGLSSYDRLTPRALVATLEADWNGPNRATVIDDLPLAGVRGTLAASFIGSLAERRTFAKTGSLNHTRGLAGYLATRRHGAVTFAWSVDDWMGTDAGLEALRASVLSRIIGD